MKLLLALLLLILTPLAYSQAGHIDTTFASHPGNGGADRTGFDNAIFSSALQPDGKLLLGGLSFTFDGHRSTGIVRLNADGTFDESFTSPLDYPEVTAITLQADGMILLADEAGVGGIKRLYPDGAPDLTFNPALTMINSISDLLVLSDGRILVSGSFHYEEFFNPENERYNFIALNSNGTLDENFEGYWNTGTAMPYISAMYEQPDGKILVSGSIFDGIESYAYLARLNADGTMDTEILPLNTVPGSILDMAPMPNGQIYAAGTIDGGILLFNSNGTIDPAFDPEVIVLPDDTNGIEHSGIYTLCVQPDGKLLIGGMIGGPDGSETGYGRLNTDGTWDTSFHLDGGVGKNKIAVIERNTDGSIVIAGGFLLVNHVPRHFAAKLDANGNLAADYIPVTGIAGQSGNVFPAPDQKLMIMGDFVGYGGIYRKGLARINTDGTLDPSFDPGDGFNLPYQSSIVFQQDGRMIIGGSFQSYNGIPFESLIRLNADGSVDPAFNMGTGLAYTSVSQQGPAVNKVLLLSNGKLLVAGRFDRYNGTPVSNLLRLNPDGSLDPSFSCSTDGDVGSVTLQADGKILIAGLFSNCNGAACPHFFIRLNPNGSTDESFSPSASLGYYSAICVQPDGKILVSGSVQNACGYPDVARLNANGSADNTFNCYPGTGALYNSTLLLQPDGKIVLCGNITSFNGTPVQKILRLNSDGTLDPSFLIENGLDGPSNVYSGILSNMIMQTDGRIIVAGYFNNYDGVTRNGLVRLKNDVTGFSTLQVQFTGLQDISCAGVGSVTAVCSGGTPPYTFSWSDGTSGAALEVTEGGVYQVTVTDSLGYTGIAALLMNAPGTSAADLSSNLVATTFRTGFPATAWLNSFNDGCIPASGELKLVKDPLLDFVSSDPAPSSVNGDTLTWDFSAMTFDSPHFTPRVEFITSVSASIGDSIHLKVSVTTPQNDINSANNVHAYAYPVINGYDPNTKSAYPAGKCGVGYIEQDQVLTYTVHFQNTGNSEAINIAVKDVLDPGFDLNTVRVTAGSHDLWTEVLPYNTLKFHFDDIHLADSTGNEPESHGYVIFEVRPVHSYPLAHNTEIANTAAIYFDFNPAVVTNTVSHLIFQGGLDAYNCFEAGIGEFLSDAPAFAYPNPTTGKTTVEFGREVQNASVTITDLQGKIILSETGIKGQQLIVDLSGMNNGIYLFYLKETGSNLQSVTRLVRQ